MAAFLEVARGDGEEFDDTQWMRKANEMPEADS
jgi:hypothetical protein